MKPKVFLINNYSMERAYSLWEKGISGSHHVWGKVELDQRGKVAMTVFPHEKNSIYYIHLTQNQTPNFYFF